MLSLAQLIAAGVAPTPARTVLAPLLAACAKYDIGSSARMAAFIGQCMVESNGFTSFEENLWWTTPERVCAFFPSRVPNLARAAQLVCRPQALANCVYADKNGNGPEASGDGWRYRGRGGLGLTWLGNYRAAELATGRPYVLQPDLVAEPADAMLTAAWYWDANELNRQADLWKIDLVTRLITGPAMPDRARRIEASLTALRALRSTFKDTTA